MHLVEKTLTEQKFSSIEEYASASREDTETTGISNPYESPCTTPAVILIPVYDPGPQPNIIQSKSDNSMPASKIIFSVEW